jgi:hypothetical protein
MEYGVSRMGKTAFQAESLLNRRCFGCFVVATSEESVR